METITPISSSVQGRIELPFSLAPIRHSGWVLEGTSYYLVLGTCATHDRGLCPYLTWQQVTTNQCC